VYRTENGMATVVLANIMCITAGSAAVNKSHYTADQRIFVPVTRCAQRSDLIHNTI